MPGTALAAPPLTASAPSRLAPRRPAVLLPTAVVADGGRRPPHPAERKLTQITSELDALLTDAAQDLGLSVDLSGRSAAEPALASERDLPGLARAAGRLHLAPAIALLDNEVELRLELADPASRALRV